MKRMYVLSATLCLLSTVAVSAAAAPAALAVTEETPAANPYYDYEKFYGDTFVFAFSEDMGFDETQAMLPEIQAAAGTEFRDIYWLESLPFGDAHRQLYLMRTTCGLQDEAAMYAIATRLADVPGVCAVKIRPEDMWERLSAALIVAADSTDQPLAVEIEFPVSDEGFREAWDLGAAYAETLDPALYTEEERIKMVSDYRLAQRQRLQRERIAESRDALLTALAALGLTLSDAEYPEDEAYIRCRLTKDDLQTAAETNVRMRLQSERDAIPPEVEVNVNTTTLPTTADGTTNTFPTTTLPTTTSFTMTTTLPTANPPAQHTGDVNCDGAIDVRDAVLLARTLSEDKTAEVTPQGMQNADTTADGAVNDSDLSALLHYLAGKGGFLVEF